MSPLIPLALPRLRNPFAGYRPSWVRPDLLGALTVVAILVPEGVAYAAMSGVPPQCAFYAAPVVLLIYAVAGSSRNLAVAATAPAAVLTSAAVTGVSVDPARAPALAAALSVLSGGILLVTGIARCGFIADFLAPPVLTGFLAAMSLVIMVRQAARYVGLHSADGDFFVKAVHILRDARQWNGTSIAVATAGLVLLLALERWLPRIPSTLAVLVLGIVASPALGLHAHGVAVVGEIPRALPALRVPHVAAGHWWHLAEQSGGLALIVFAVSFSVAQRLDVKDGGRAPDANREMAALGLANIGAGLVGGFPVSGSPSASPAQREAGGRTPAVGVYAAAGIVLVAAFCTPAFPQLPEPVLAAIILAAVRGFVVTGAATLRRYWYEYRPSFWTAVTALVGVLLFELLPGLLLAVALSLGVFIWQAGQLTVSELGQLPGRDEFTALERRPKGAAPCPGLVIARADGALFFGNTRRLDAGLQDLLAETSDARVLVLDISASYRLPLPVVDVVASLRARLRSREIDLWFSRVHPLAAQALEAGPLADVPRYPSPEAALDAFRADRAVS
jgi:MFS superfamily sulfate permease-like transporter